MNNVALNSNQAYLLAKKELPLWCLSSDKCEKHQEWKNFINPYELTKWQNNHRKASDWSFHNGSVVVSPTESYTKHSAWWLWNQHSHWNEVKTLSWNTCTFINPADTFIQRYTDIHFSMCDPLLSELITHDFCGVNTPFLSQLSYWKTGVFWMVFKSHWHGTYVRSLWHLSNKHVKKPQRPQHQMRSCQRNMTWLLFIIKVETPALIYSMWHTVLARKYSSCCVTSCIGHRLPTPITLTAIYSTPIWMSLWIFYDVVSSFPNLSDQVSSQTPPELDVCVCMCVCVYLCSNSSSDSPSS